MTAPLKLLIKYLSKIGKVKVAQEGQVGIITWQLKPLSFFWEKYEDGNISISVRRLSFREYVVIGAERDKCSITVNANIYFKDVKYPEEFTVDGCKIYVNSKKRVLIYFSNIQYHKCCEASPNH